MIPLRASPAAIRAASLVSLSFLIAATLPGDLPAFQHSTTRVYGSQLISLTVPNEESSSPAISCDGTYIAYSSEADNLVVDTNDLEDVFVAARGFPVPHRVSVSSLGLESDGPSYEPDVSDEGEFVVFTSDASNLIPVDSNGVSDIFVHEVATGVTERISVSTLGLEANGPSLEPSISRDGRYVAFTSHATNLVFGDSNAAADVFVHDRAFGITSLISIDSLGAQGDAGSFEPAIDGSGNFIVFTSHATNFTADGNGVTDIFLRDRSAGTTVRVTNNTTGGDPDFGSRWPAISCNGELVTYTSAATNLILGDVNGFQDVFLEDRGAMTRSRVSVDSAGVAANDNSFFSAVSDTAKVTFDSNASNLVLADTNSVRDVFVHNRSSGSTVRSSIDSSGAQSNARSRGPDITEDGCDVVYASLADNLVPPDFNMVDDIYVHRRAPICVTLSFVPVLVDIGGITEINSYGGTPFAPFGLFLTQVNGIPSPQLLGVFPYDGAGRFTFDILLPNDPILRGTILSMQVFTNVAGMAGLQASNEAFFSVQQSF